MTFLSSPALPKVSNNSISIHELVTLFQCEIFSTVEYAERPARVAGEIMQLEGSGQGGKWYTVIVLSICNSVSPPPLRTNSEL